LVTSSFNKTHGSVTTRQGFPAVSILKKDF
jgi:hypothetical protein